MHIFYHLKVISETHTYAYISRHFKHETALVPQSLMLPAAVEPAWPSNHLLSPSLLLRSQSLSSLLSVPPALSVLHNLALNCVLHGR